VREIRDVKAIMDEERAVLLKKGISFDPLMETGILVEVPGAVEILDKLLNYVDFISIGTNDLIQYVLAVDRNNQKVAEIYNPLDPAVISIIHRAAKIARDKGKAVAICGESASHPKCAYLYVGMGLDRLSMNAASVPVIKHMIRRTSLVEAKRALRRVLRMEDASEIDHYLDKVIPDRMEEKAYAS
jgi:phosphoenolpyruvate-protein kinase (PTS system EI component)